MTEPTPPTDTALFKALKDLIVEAQAVADDHHRPRYMRLDQALASARNAMLDYWAATPQPTQPQAGAVPLTPDQIKAMAREYPAEDLCGWSYRLGIADAEAHHGIKGGQHGTNN